MEPTKLTQSYGNKLPPEDRPLTNKETIFAHEYVKGSSGAASVRAAGYKVKNSVSASVQANQLLKKPNVVKYINHLKSQARSEAIAGAEEVLEYLTRVMRGEILDTNNKPVCIAERSRAAIELAKRTVDLEKTSSEDNVIRVQLDWNRPENPVDQSAQDGENEAESVQSVQSGD